MAYRDPKTGVLYPSKEWMVSHAQNLPEVQKAYPNLSVGEVKNVPAIEPTPTKPQDNAKSVVSKTSALTNLNITVPNEGETTNVEEQKKGFLDWMKNTWQGMLNKVSSMPTANTEDILKQQQAQYQVQQQYQKMLDLQPQIATLQDQINKLDEQEAKDLAAIEATPGMGMRFISGKQKELQREYAIKRNALAADLAAKAALVQMYRGNINEARSLIQDAVNAATYDISQKRADIKNIINTYGGFVSSIGSTYLDMLKDKERQLENEEKERKNEMIEVANLVMKYPGADWPSDWHKLTLEDALPIAQAYAKTHQPGNWRYITKGNELWRYDPTTGKVEKVSSFEGTPETTNADDIKLKVLNAYYNLKAAAKGDPTLLTKQWLELQFTKSNGFTDQQIKLARTLIEQAWDEDTHTLDPSKWPSGTTATPATPEVKTEETPGLWSRVWDTIGNWSDKVWGVLHR